jgi:hypothetical protein
MDPTALADFTYQIQVFFLSMAVILASLGGLFALGFLLVAWLKYKDREESSLEYVMLQIAVPRNNEVKIDAAEQMFTAFDSLYKSGRLQFLKNQPHICFEIVAKPGDIRFYCSCPASLRDFVEKQIYGAYPGADIVQTEEYNIFSEAGHVQFGGLKLKKDNFYPIKSYRELATDPLSGITSTLGKMQEGEGASLQILLSPAGSKWKKAGQQYVSYVKKRESDPEKAKYSTDPKSLELISNKASKPGFKTVIRMVVSSTNETSAKMHMTNLKGAFAQFGSDLNGLSGTKQLFKRLFMIDFIYRYFPILEWWRYKQISILSSEELATLFHLPNKSIETPHIFWLNAKRSPASALIPTTGLFMGNSRYRGQARPIYLSDDDRRRHVYTIGKTGTGKSEFLKAMIMQDIKNGKGLAVIDPHGDLINGVLPLIPPSRAEDVIVFDPSDTERPMGLNMLEASTEEQKHYVVTSIVGLMYKLYDPMKTGIIGPRFEHAVRNAMLTVMSEPGNTFIEVVRVLTDSAFVQELLPKVTDPIIRRYWTDQIAQTSDFHKSEVLDYIVSKFGRFVTNKMIRNIIGQSKSSFNFRTAMDEQKILLINLSKGKLGEENSNFLGLILVPRILIAAMSRQDTPEELRKDFYLYVDEFQNFATPDFAQILSEARKYRLNLIVANQFIGQMEEEVKNAIFGNVGTIASFRVGVNDGNYLSHEFQPVFNESDLINVERYNAYMKTVVNNEPVPPFSVDMTRDMSIERKAANPKVAQAIIQLSRLKYGKPRELIEAEIAQRARL